MPTPSCPLHLRHALAAAGAIGIAFAAATAFAQVQQKFPSRPVRLLVGLPAGSQADTVTRLIGGKLSETWGWPVVVDNRPGAAGMLASVALAKAPPDGHTLLYAGINFAVSAVLQADLPYDPIRDFAGVGHIGYGVQALAAGPALGVKSVSELVALARERPGKLIFGSPATGGGSHLSGARFNLVTGIKVVHVAFKGGSEAVIETVAGRTHYTVVPVITVLPFTKDGKLLVLAVFTPQRSPALPDVPALAETMPEFGRPDGSNGLLAPAKTPRPIVQQIGKDLARILARPEVRERLQAFGYAPVSYGPEEYDKVLREQINTMSRVVRDIGLRPK